VDQKAATDVFVKDCLIRLGTAVAPVGAGKEGQRCLKATVQLPGGTQEFEIPFGAMRRIELGVDEKAEATLEPAGSFDLGMGKGKSLKTTLQGGVAGLIFDCRGRQPFVLPEDREQRIRKLKEWAQALDTYPAEGLTIR